MSSACIRSTRVVLCPKLVKENNKRKKRENIIRSLEFIKLQVKNNDVSLPD